MLFFGTPVVAVLGLALASGRLAFQASRPAPVQEPRDPPLSRRAPLGD
jgi:hypothetical protein